MLPVVFVKGEKVKIMKAIFKYLGAFLTFLLSLNLKSKVDPQASH